MNDRIMPESKEIERAILGGCMVSFEASAEASEIIKEEHFFSPANGVMFRILKQMYIRNIRFDQLLFEKELEKIGVLEKIGGSATVSGIMRDTASGANIKEHCEIVIENYQRRKLILLCEDVASKAEKGNISIGEIINNANVQFDKIIEDDNKIGFQVMQDLLLQAKTEILELNERKEIMGIPTGFPALDKLTNGWQDGDTIIVGAEKKAGKSFMGAILACEAISKGYSVGIFSLEMMALPLVKRLISYKARVDTADVVFKKLTDEDKKSLDSACEVLQDYSQIIYDDTAGINIEEMTVKAKRMKKLYDIKMLVVDYIQLMPSVGNEGRQREIEKISHGLKSIAKNLNIPVIIISQFSRPQKGNEKKAPLMSDLRDSGALEADASIVLLIYTPDIDRKKNWLDYKKQPWNENDEIFDNIRELIVAANRNGRTGEIPLIFRGDIASFTEMSQNQGE